MDETTNLTVIQALFPEKRKEYACHVQYVALIGVRLAAEYAVDRDVIEIACLLHDLGRDRELPGEDHAQTSRRLAEDVLARSSLSPEQLQMIYACILTHGSEEVPESIEQQIVRSADAGSKVEYHEAFMLMCKKDSYEDRLAWGMKYLEKGYAKISIESYRQQLVEKYESIHSMYQATLGAINHVS